MRSLILAILLITTACSQNPARIEYEGDKFFGQFIDDSELAVIAKTRTVVVKRGDSLSKLADRYDVSTNQLIKLNSLKHPYIIQVGQVLKLPESKTHKVRRGESLGIIADRFGVSPYAIAKLNDIDAPYIIFVDQALKIPSKHEADIYVKGAKKAAAPKTAFKTVSKPTPPKPKATKKASKPKKVAKKSTPKKRAKKTSVHKKPGKFSWPARGKVISKFGAKQGGIVNDGINISAKPGAAVKAVNDGEVVYVGNELKGYGNLVIVKHNGGWLSAYAHLNVIRVRQYDDIRKGQLVGNVGSTGKVSKPQLHFALRRGRDPVDPLLYLGR